MFLIFNQLYFIGGAGDMLFDTESRLYYKQYDLEYDVRGNSTCSSTPSAGPRSRLNSLIVQRC